MSPALSDLPVRRVIRALESVGFAYVRTKDKSCGLPAPRRPKLGAHSLLSLQALDWAARRDTPMGQETPVPWSGQYPYG